MSAANEESHETSEKGNGIQLAHALFDCDVFSKPKLKTMRIRFGHLARLWFIDVILDMSRATNGVIDECLVLELAREIGIEQPQDLLLFALEEGILTKLPNNKITNRRVQEDREKLRKRRDSDVERQRKYRDSRVTRPLQARDTTVFPVTDTVTDTDTVLDLKKNSAPPPVPEPPKPKPPKNKIAVTFPPKWGERSQATFWRWVEYRRERKKPLKSMSYQAQINAYAEDPKRFVALVERTIANGWDGLNPQIPLETGPPSANAPPRKTFEELDEERRKREREEVFKRFLEEEKNENDAR